MRPMIQPSERQDMVNKDAYDKSPNHFLTNGLMDELNTSKEMNKNLFTEDAGHKPDVGPHRKNRQSWKEELRHFAKRTTFHGVRFIFLEKMWFPRRLLWMILFLTCSVLMSVQIIERIVYYYDYPVTVNVHVNFNKTLAFPALTLCNQNAFRASAAAEHNLYRVLEKMYSHNGGLDLIANQSNISNETLDRIFRLTAHRKEDLIIGCEWLDGPCSPDNFTEVLTDHGLCYTFNQDIDTQLLVTSAGSHYGLKLTLNVEQYEYMPGPHNAAGVKILLHNKKEFPMVGELGLAVSTGTHAFVGIQLSWIRNLPKPHGACRSEKSPYYDRYSPDACQLTCMTELLNQLCGCRHMYMPHVNGSPPICTIQQYITCYTDMADTVKDEVQATCECPVPCDFLIYDPTISYASSSLYGTDRLLTATATSRLRQKFLHAREVTSRMDGLKFQTFVKLETDVSNTYDELNKIIVHDVLAKIRRQKEELMSIYSNMRHVWTEKEYLLEWQIYHMTKNFIRPRDAMEERTLNYFMLGFQEYSYQVEARIQQLANPPDNITLTPDVRTTIYIEIMNMLNGRLDLADRGFSNYTQLYEAYQNGTPIFRYKFRNEHRDNNIFITPKPLLKEALFRNSYVRKYSAKMGRDILSIKRKLQVYSGLANTSYVNHTLDPIEHYEANVHFLTAGRRFYNSRSIFYKDSVEYPLRVLEEKLADFRRRWREFESEFNWMSDRINQLLSRLDVLEHSILQYLENTLDIAQIYIYNGSITKLEVAESLTSKQIFNGILDLKNFFQELRSRGEDIFSGWTPLLYSVKQIWAVVLNDENLEEFYSYKNMTEYLQNYTDVAQEVERNFSTVRDANDFRFSLGNVDSVFLNRLDLLMADMALYIENSQLNTDFIRENFLQLDIFYKEKSYEQITQQTAYDIFALFCDIGGSMGLFVGASAMTIYELVDLFLHQSLQGWMV